MELFALFRYNLVTMEYRLSPLLGEEYWLVGKVWQVVNFDAETKTVTLQSLNCQRKDILPLETFQIMKRIGLMHPYNLEEIDLTNLINTSASKKTEQPKDQSATDKVN